jgi:hypothetical protein
MAFTLVLKFSDGLYLPDLFEAFPKLEGYFILPTDYSSEAKRVFDDSVLKPPMSRKFDADSGEIKGTVEGLAARAQEFGLQYEFMFGNLESASIVSLLQRRQKAGATTSGTNYFNYFYVFGLTPDVIMREKDILPAFQELSQRGVLELAYRKSTVVSTCTPPSDDPVEIAPSPSFLALHGPVHAPARPVRADLIAVEWGWRWDHPALSHLEGRPAQVPGTGINRPRASDNHGTQMASLVLGQDAANSFEGCARWAGFRYAPISFEKNQFQARVDQRETALMAAIDAATNPSEGTPSPHVILMAFGVQMGTHSYPAEFERAIYDLVRDFSILVPIVATAGNSNQDLDVDLINRKEIKNYFANNWPNSLIICTLQTPSGGLLVGGVYPDGKLDTSFNHSLSGRRVRCYALSREVRVAAYTLGDVSTYTLVSGTSPAAACVAGLILALQGEARSAGRVLSASEINRAFGEAGAPVKHNDTELMGTCIPHLDRLRAHFQLP